MPGGTVAREHSLLREGRLCLDENRPDRLSLPHSRLVSDAMAVCLTFAAGATGVGVSSVYVRYVLPRIPLAIDLVVRTSVALAVISLWPLYVDALAPADARICFGGASSDPGLPVPVPATHLIWVAVGVLSISVITRYASRRRPPTMSSVSSLLLAGAAFLLLFVTVGYATSEPWSPECIPGPQGVR